MAVDHIPQDSLSPPNGPTDAGARSGVPSVQGAADSAVPGRVEWEQASAREAMPPAYGYPPAPYPYPVPPYFYPPPQFPYPPPQYAYPQPYPYPPAPPPALAPREGYAPEREHAQKPRRRGCGGDCPPPSDCGCEDECVCCFEVLITRVRVMEDQGGALSGGSGVGEPGDGGVFSDDMELVFNVLADGMGEVYPSLTSFISISKRHKWVAVNKVINRLPVPCGGTRTVSLVAEVMEVETTLVGGRAEVGSESGTIVLACGCPTVPAQILVRLAAGGQADQGEVLVEVTARQV